MGYSKLYQRVNVTGWENDPSPKTPLDADNLNNMDKGIDDLDNRILELNEAKSDRNEVASMFTDVSLDSSTGIITFTKYDGSKKQIDTMLEKVVTNFDFDETTQKLTLTLEDWTIKEVDLSSFISEYEFEDSDTIVWEVVDHKVVANIRNRSIGADQLETDYLANCEIAEDNASNSASRAIDEALKSEGYSVGTQNGIPVDSTSPYYHNNAKYYSDKTGARTLASLDDVALSNVEEGQALVYDAENDKWVNGDAIPKYKLNAPTNVSATAQNESVVLKWTDPDDLILGENVLAKWIGTAIIQKVGSAPTSIEDGTPIYASMVRNQHSEVGYVVEGLENDTEYFFGVFPVTEERVANTSVVVSATPEGNINHIKEWCQTIGLSYENLENITEADMRKLMSKHTSVDYFMEWYSADNAMLDDFTQSEIAMKWIGLNDYIADKLLAIEDAESRLLASPYWEYILKDHVPIMTSNTAPYGTVSGSNSYVSEFDFYKAFDGNDSTMWRGSSNTSYNQSVSGYIEYAFPNPICVKRVKYVVPILGSAKPQTTDILFVGYNGTEEIPLTIASVDGDEYVLSDYVYITKLRVTVTQKNLDSNPRVVPAIATLQFYGRSLNVSVPTMTSNTAPYGEVIYNGESNPIEDKRYPYKAFNKIKDDPMNACWLKTTNGTMPYLGYDFKKDIVLKFVCITLSNGSTSILPNSFQVETSTDGEHWNPFGDVLTQTASDINPRVLVVTNSEGVNCRMVRVITTQVIGNQTYSIMYRELEFFGVDYSDRTERTYLYDHGVELVPILTSTGGGTQGKITKESNKIVIDGHTESRYHVYAPMTFGSYKLMRVIIADIHDTKGTGESTTPYLGVRKNITESSGGSGVAASTFRYDLLPYCESLDISSINGDYQACIGTTQTHTTSFNEWWLE